MIPYREQERRKKEGSGNICPGAHNTVSGWWNRDQKEGDYKATVRVGRQSRITADIGRDYLKGKCNFKTSERGKDFGISSVGAFYW